MDWAINMHTNQLLHMHKWVAPLFWTNMNIIIIMCNLPKLVNISYKGHIKREIIFHQMIVLNFCNHFFIQQCLQSTTVHILRNAYIHTSCLKTRLLKNIFPLLLMNYYTHRSKLYTINFICTNLKLMHLTRYAPIKK